MSHPYSRTPCMAASTYSINSALPNQKKLEKQYVTKLTFLRSDNTDDKN